MKNLFFDFSFGVMMVMVSDTCGRPRFVVLKLLSLLAAAAATAHDDW